MLRQNHSKHMMMTTKMMPTMRRTIMDKGVQVKATIIYMRYGRRICFGLDVEMREAAGVEVKRQ